MKTRTGAFPIGWRNRQLSWEETPQQIIDFARMGELSVVDLQSATPETLATYREAGMAIGSVDLPDWSGMIAADPARRKQALEANRECVLTLGSEGVQHFFAAMLPENPDLPRKENFQYLVESCRELAEELDSAGADLVIEGWPGKGCLVSTPETYRALLEETPACIGINYDPSHLVRMGIDPLRFLSEFLPRVYHAHGKDALIDAERLYQYGSEVDPLDAEKPAHGGWHWRYTIPGHGMTPWITILSMLRDGGYRGAICIEFEDAHFIDTPEQQQAGTIEGARFLSHC